MANIIFWSGVWGSTQVEVMRPMASYQLSHWLRKHRISSQVIEFCQLLTFKDIIDMTEASISKDTLAIGLSSTFWPMSGKVPNEIVLALTYFKQKYPKIKVIMGGPRVNRPQYKFLSHMIDKRISGEGENDLLSYLQELKYGVRFPNPQFDITSLDHVYTDADCILENEILPIELGRGCIFKCKFCAYPNIGKKKHTYQRNFENVYQEFRHNYDNFGTTRYMFMDDTSNEDQEKMDFLKTIPSRISKDFMWGGYCRLDLIYSHKNHDTLFESGLRQVYFGLESFDRKAASVIGKAWNGKQAKEFLPTLMKEHWKGQVGLSASFIIGLPYETEESIFQTVNYINEQKLGYLFFLPFNLKQEFEKDAPVSEFTKNSSSYGYELDENKKWRNKFTNITEDRAHELTTITNDLIRDTRRVGGWHAMTPLNLGADQHDIILNMGWRERTNFIEINKAQFADRYKKKFWEYINSR
jgi:radical SAM superfamily enzyme YgiQ (UPF0313 family)